MSMKKKSGTRAAPTAAKVVPFPALPDLPLAPSFAPDPRQSSFSHVRGVIGKLAGAEMRVAGANLASGFPSSAVDLGALQDAIQAGVSRFTAKQLRRRWLVDVRAWVQRVVLTWVQRVKRLTVVLRARGVHITIETQDDRGYYRYELDAFPRG